MLWRAYLKSRWYLEELGEAAARAEAYCVAAELANTPDTFHEDEEAKVFLPTIYGGPPPRQRRVNWRSPQPGLTWADGPGARRAMSNAAGQVAIHDDLKGNRFVEVDS